MFRLIYFLAMLFTNVGAAYADCIPPPNLIDFGAVNVGSSASFRHDLTNPLQAPAPATASVSVGGANASDFTAALSCSGQQVPPGGSCSVTLTFHPSNSGPKDALLNFTLNGYWACDGVFNSMSITIVGRGVDPGTFDPLAGLPSTLPAVVQSVTPVGTATSLSLSSQMKFDPSIAGQQGSMFIGAHVPPLATFNGVGQGQIQSASEMRSPQEASDAWYIGNGSSWSQYLGGTIAPLFTGVLNDASSIISVLNNVDASRFCGTEFYVGYGTSGDAMLANNTLGKIYTVMCNFAFTGVPNGAISGLTLSANLQVATLDVGKQGNLYVGKLSNGAWSLNNGSAWVPYSGGEVPPYASGTLASRTIQIFNGENLSGQSGVQIYIGYGLTSDDLLNNHKYGLVYTVQ